MEKMNTVQTNYGMVQGVEEGNSVVFKGIPYAKAPVGELRWKPPVAPEAWESVRICDTWGDTCMQMKITPEVTYMAGYYKEFHNYDSLKEPEFSEDCLYLNIWVPKDAADQKLPVAFWIHGGAFMGGYGAEIEFDGQPLNEKGVILVTINYRLGVFGYLAHPWLTAESERHISGNYGSLDQVAALNWVYENIENFGGDPQNITVYGQSAGSMSTQVLINSELTEGKIRRAILQSGISCEERVLYTPHLDEMEKLGEVYVGMTGAKSLEELRAMSAEKLEEIRGTQFTGYCFETMHDPTTMVPNADGYLLKKTVKEFYEEDNIRDISYMLGSTANDLGMSPEEVANEDPGVLQIECWRMADKIAEKCSQPAYVYWFSHKLPGDDWGAFHSSELWYTFGTLDRCWRPMTDDDHELSEEMLTCWTNFMKTGNPNNEGDDEWEAYTAENPLIYEFN